MDRYMERRLVGLHEAGTSAHLKHKVLTFLASLVIIVSLPYLHLGVFYHIWAPDKPDVNKAKCSCDCFDTVFRGQYEWPPSAYKHVYFNSTRSTLQIWVLVVLGVLGLYETLRYVLMVAWSGTLRYTMVLVLISALYPHYYGWWGLFNYLNEEYPYQWAHQIFFSITEALSTLMVVHLCNNHNKIEPWKLLIILNINLMHIIVGCLDQFVGNIIYGEAKSFEAIRDIALLMPDIFHCLVPFFELQTMAEKRQISFFRLFYREELMLFSLILVLSSLLGKVL